MRRFIVATVVAVGTAPLVPAGMVGPASAATSTPRSSTTTAQAARNTRSVIVLRARRFNPANGKTLYVVNTTIGPDVKGKRKVTKVVTNAAGVVRSRTRSTVAASANGTISGTQTDPAATGRTNGSLGSSGCCSASGGWNVTVWGSDCWSWCKDYTFNSWMQFCWGGGVPYVHWGYVFNCQHGLGSPYYPATGQYFSAINPPDRNPRASQWHLNYFNWANMNYSFNTGFYDWQQGALDVCAAVCYYTHYPTITIWAHANGEYDYSGNFPL